MNEENQMEFVSEREESMVHYGEGEALDMTNDDGNIESGSEAGDVMQLSKTTH